jgi:hypothetical protein
MTARKAAEYTETDDNNKNSATVDTNSGKLNPTPVI